MSSLCQEALPCHCFTLMPAGSDAVCAYDETEGECYFCPIDFCFTFQSKTLARADPDISVWVFFCGYFNLNSTKTCMFWPMEYKSLENRENKWIPVTVDLYCTRFFFSIKIQMYRINLFQLTVCESAYTHWYLKPLLCSRLKWHSDVSEWKGFKI